MAITIDQANLGEGFDDTLDTAWTFNTTAAVASSGFIVVVVGWFGGTPVLSSVSGGGLTWIVDHESDTGASAPRFAVASAQAPSGLASSTTLTITLSDVAVGKFATGMSFTGVKTTSPVDGTPPTMTEGATAGWATGNNTISAGSVVVGGCWIDSNTTHEPTSPSIEASQHNAGTNTLAALYRIESSSGTYTLAGTFGAAADWAAASVAYLAAAGGGTQTICPDSDITTTGWTSTPLWSKIGTPADATIITATAA